MKLGDARDTTKRHAVDRIGRFCTKVVGASGCAAKCHTSDDSKWGCVAPAGGSADVATKRHSVDNIARSCIVSGNAGGSAV